MIETIIEALKTRAPSFVGRVGGAAAYKPLEPAANLVMPAAYVIHMDDEAGPQTSSNGYNQVVDDVFAVIVVLSNTPDERGQTALSSIHSIRAELWAALLAWQPDTEHGAIEYRGGQLLDLDRARLYYQFEFSTRTEISEADTWQGIANAALPAFTTMEIQVDTIDPFDPNRVAPGERGPDGTIDATVLIDVPQ